MNEAARGSWTSIGYTGARRLVLWAGLAVLAVVGLVAYSRGVDPDEVRATLLFIPIFVALVIWGVRGGFLSAVGAAVVYVVLRYPDIQLVGAERYTGLIASRSVAYLAFGLLGGWASRQLSASLTKLELYDQIDDATGLFNARFFVQDTDLEVTRSKRYQTLFSVAVVDIPSPAFDALSRRQRAGALRELGRMLRDSVRTVDRAVHAESATHHRLAVVLPETGAEGARVFADRFSERVADYLSKRGAPIGKGELRQIASTYPEDEATLEKLRSEFREIDRTEHPEEQKVEQPSDQPAEQERK